MEKQECIYRSKSYLHKSNNGRDVNINLALTVSEETLSNDLHEKREPKYKEEVSESSRNLESFDDRGIKKKHDRASNSCYE